MPAYRKAALGEPSAEAEAGAGAEAGAEAEAEAGTEEAEAEAETEADGWTSRGRDALGPPWPRARAVRPARAPQPKEETRHGNAGTAQDAQPVTLRRSGGRDAPFGRALSRRRRLAISARRFDAYRVLLELIALVDPFIARIAKHDAKLADQLAEALPSTIQNFAEAT